jgi:hypothetical protein
MVRIIGDIGKNIIVAVADQRVLKERMALNPLALASLQAR